MFDYIYGLFWFAIKNPDKMPIVLLTFLLQRPQLIRRYFQADSTTLHECLYSTCLRLHIPALVPKVESAWFKSPRTHEVEVAEILANTSGELFVDVGAGLGRYTVLLGGKYRQVIAVEPEPQNMQCLRSNIACAGLTNVQFFQCAVSDKDGYADLHLSSGHATHTICSDYVHQCDLHKGKVRVKTLTLASILRNRRTDLVKVDVEGAEWLVLKGAEPIIEKIRSWVVELHDFERKKELEKWFKSRGYSIRWLGRNRVYTWSDSSLNS